MVQLKVKLKSLVIVDVSADFRDFYSFLYILLGRAKLAC